MKEIIIATRPSHLARWQTQWVIHLLQHIHKDVVFVEHVISTKGDRELDKPLPLIGGKGLFTQELENELLNKKVHAAVHSLKDLPVQFNPQLTVGAIPKREDVRDVLVSAKGYKLEDLPAGAIIGTSSYRRAAQLLSINPQLKIEPLRGNIDTRLKKAATLAYDGILLAAAGILRLGYEKFISQYIPLEVMLPAPAQGALAVQCRADDKEVLNMLAAIDDPNTRKAVSAERAFLQGLGGGCSIPLAAYAACLPTETSTKQVIKLKAVVLNLDGSKRIDVEGSGDDALLLGEELAQKALQQGAHQLLNQV